MVLAERGVRAEAEGFNAREQPASELFGIERGDGAIELEVGLAVGGKKKVTLSQTRISLSKADSFRG